MISFHEFSMMIDKQFLDAFKLFAKIRNGQEEKTEKEWKALFQQFINKQTN